MLAKSAAAVRLTGHSRATTARVRYTAMNFGGGDIDVEQAQILARAGVDVTIFSRFRILPAAEPEIGEALREYFADEGIRTVGGIANDAIEITDAGTGLHVRRETSSAAISSSTWRPMAPG